MDHNQDPQYPTPDDCVRMVVDWDLEGGTDYQDRPPSRSGVMYDEWMSRSFPVPKYIHKALIKARQRYDITASAVDLIARAYGKD